MLRSTAAVARGVTILAVLAVARLPGCAESTSQLPSDDAGEDRDAAPADPPQDPSPEDPCPSGMIQCSGFCLDPLSAHDNCGGCGHVCAPAQVCNGGGCDLECAAGLTDCVGDCADLESSEQHCGVCARACGPDEECRTGECRSGVTTCSVTVTPPSGALSTTFLVQIGSNGTSCRYTIDGTPYDIAGCLLSLPLAGSAVGAGVHTVALSVGDGPGGAASCSTSFVVTEETTCSLSIAPSAGFMDTTFYSSTGTNGSGCTYTVDGGAPVACECNAVDAPFPGSYVGVGLHTLTLHVASGPGGPASCSATVTVNERTTCSLSIAPSAGFMDTTFYASTGTNGSGCTYTVDGGAPIACECNATDASFPGSYVGVGIHTFTLYVASGPGGPAQCSATITVS